MMKKVFFLIATVALSLGASAQKFGASFHGTTYANGDTIVLNEASQFSILDDFEAVMDLEVTNLTDNSISTQVRVDDIDNPGFQFGVCLGTCIEGRYSLIAPVEGHGEVEVPIHFVHLGMYSHGMFLINVYDTENEGDTLQIYCDLTVPGASSIEGVQEQSQLSAYPNPATHGQATVCYEMEGQQGELILSDMAGRQVKRVSLRQSQGSVSLDLQGLPAGIYTYAILSQGRLSTAQKLAIR